MSQCSDILKHMQTHGSITPAQAHSLYGSLACHSRIAELRERGHDIHTEMIDTPSGKSVGRYSLNSAPRPAGGQASGKPLIDNALASGETGPGVGAEPHEQLITCHRTRTVNGKVEHYSYQYTAVGHNREPS